MQAQSPPFLGVFLQRRSILSLPAGLLFLLPAGVFVFVFIILPFFWIAAVSFTNRTLTGRSAVNPEFVGFANYARLFDPERFLRSGEFGSSLLITGQFVFFSALVGQALLGLLLAYFFYGRRGWVQGTVQTLAILAWIMPDVVVAFAWFAFLNYDAGTLNQIFSGLGLGRPDWLLRSAARLNYHLQHLAGNCLFDAAFFVGARLDSAESPRDRFGRRGDGLAKAARHHFAAYQNAHRHGPYFDNLVELQHLYAVFADRWRPGL